MLKRKISLFLVVVMLLTIFAGCDMNELGYMNLSTEIGRITQMGIKSSTQIEVAKEITGKESNINLDIDFKVM